MIVESGNGEAWGEKSVLECLRLNSDGSGVGYLNGRATFVPGLLPGEIGEIQVGAVKKKWQRARLQNILRSSPKRLEAPCSVFAACGGCQLQHTVYEETLFWKRRWVEDALFRIGKVKAEVKPTIGLSNPWRYRNKARLQRDAGGRLGYYRDKSQNLIPFSDCLLLSEDMNNWIRLTDKLLEAKEFAKIHNVTFRENTKGDDILLLEGPLALEDALALKKDKVKIDKVKIDKILSLKDQEAKISASLEALYQEGICAVWNLNSEGRLTLLRGEKTFRETILGFTFDVSPLAFLQVNPLQTEVLYSLVLAEAALTGKEIVWDLYSGIGTLSLLLASKAGKVTGIEENPHAVENARQNVRNNNLGGKVAFVKGKVEAQMMQVAEHPDLVVLDPPRSGIHPRVGRRLLELGPKRIIYVSCDPGTLARDVGALIPNGYSMESVQPVDMFPWTSHVETCVLLSRVKQSEKISIKMEVGLSDITEKATYKKIKEYIMQKYGLNVHTANIAEVKRKHGLEMYEAPNKVDVRKHEYSPCVPEKVVAIEDALRYFGLLGIEQDLDE